MLAHADYFKWITVCATFGTFNIDSCEVDLLHLITSRNASSASISFDILYSHEPPMPRTDFGIVVMIVHTFKAEINCHGFSTFHTFHGLGRLFDVEFTSDL